MTRRRFLWLSGLATAGALVARVPGLRSVAAPPVIDWSQWNHIQIWKPLPTAEPLVTINGYSHLRPSDRAQALRCVGHYADHVKVVIGTETVRPDELPFVGMSAKIEDPTLLVDDVFMTDGPDVPQQWVDVPRWDHVRWEEWNGDADGSPRSGWRVVNMDSNPDGTGHHYD